MQLPSRPIRMPRIMPKIQSNESMGLPDGTISVSPTEGDLQSKTSKEFDRAPTAPLPIENLVTTAFPNPQIKYSDDEFINSLLKAAKDAIAKRSKMDAESIAQQLIESTENTSVAALPFEALEIFFDCLTLGFGFESSSGSEARTKSKNSDSEIDEEFNDLIDGIDLNSLL